VERIKASGSVQKVLAIMRSAIVTGPTMLARQELLLDLIPRLSPAQNLGTILQQIREHAKVQSGGEKKFWAHVEHYESFRDSAKKLRDELDSVIDLCRFDPEAARPSAERSLQLLRVADAVAESYQARKAELAFLDFDDLLARTHRLLCQPESQAIREKLSAETRLLLIDEFQDTDPQQVELVQSICGQMADGRLFFVGDHKQSIYRFRGARPDVFLKLREEVPGPGQLELSVNFRSQPAILDFVTL
jgi:ATP-dependent helicase/nuclease subunit A